MSRHALTNAHQTLRVRYISGTYIKRVGCVTLFKFVAYGLLKLAGFIVVSAEAPFCCMFVEFVAAYSQWVDQRPNWQKGAMYVVTVTDSYKLLRLITSLFVSQLLIVLNIAKGTQRLKRRAPRSDMMATAQATQAPASGNIKDVLVDSEIPPAMSA
ncbi:unnamed protein product, partial [Meganyctiphanes norvegica]